jgi:hypothetical protein
VIRLEVTMYTIPVSVNDAISMVDSEPKAFIGGATITSIISIRTRLKYMPSCNFENVVGVSSAAYFSTNGKVNWVLKKPDSLVIGWMYVLLRSGENLSGPCAEQCCMGYSGLRGLSDLGKPHAGALEILGRFLKSILVSCFCNGMDTFSDC